MHFQQVCSSYKLTHRTVPCATPAKNRLQGKKERIATPACWLVRNDIVFETFRSQVAAERIDTHVIAKPEGLWRSVPSSRDKRTVPCVTAQLPVSSVFQKQALKTVSRKIIIAYSTCPFSAFNKFNMGRS